jgi:hypothetical protein
VAWDSGIHAVDGNVKISLVP